MALYRGKFNAGHEWTESDQAYVDAALDRERALSTTVVHLLKRARKLRATTSNSKSRLGYYFLVLRLRFQVD